MSELVDAICAWGWDRESTASVERAEAMLAAPGSGSGSGSESEAGSGSGSESGSAGSEGGAGAGSGSDLAVSCATGDVDAVRAALAADPACARRPHGPRGWEPLLYACYSVLARTGLPRADRIVEVARALLAAGADANAHYAVAAEPEHTFPALYAAIAIADNLALARDLLEAGASPHDSQSLYHATERPTLDAVELLAAHGIRADELSYCLFHKIDFNDAAGIRWFLDHGAVPTRRHPKAGETALHWAIKRAARPHVVALLLERGADPNARTLAGVTAYPAIRATTPLDLALRVGRADLADILRAHGATATPPTADDELAFAIARTDAAAARARLAADPGALTRLTADSAPDRMLAVDLAHQNQGAAAALAASLGFDPSLRGWMGATALHWAACRGNATLARALVELGAPQLDVGGHFQTPRHTALHCRWSTGDDADYAGVLAALG